MPTRGRDKFKTLEEFSLDSTLTKLFLHSEGNKSQSASDLTFALFTFYFLLVLIFRFIHILDVLLHQQKIGRVLAVNLQRVEVIPFDCAFDTLAIG